MIDRNQITDVLCRALSRAEFAVAAWEGGSAAFDAVDSMSDIDVVVVVEDDSVEACFASVAEALSQIGDIRQTWRLPEPTWHGHAQTFYRLAKTTPFLLVDLVVMQVSNKKRFREPARHGTAKVWFEHRDVLSDAEPEYSDIAATLAAREQTLSARVELLSAFVDKALGRGDLAEALDLYHRVTLAALTELARIKHCPARFDFGMRYLYRDLPHKLADDLTKLAYVVDGTDLLSKNSRAKRRFQKLLQQPTPTPDMDKVPSSPGHDLARLLHEAQDHGLDAPRIRDTVPDVPRTLTLPTRSGEGSRPKIRDTMPDVAKTMRIPGDRDED